jgi:hypothetical protein
VNDFWLDGIRLRNVVDFFFESFQSLADTFSNLRKFARAENDEHDDQNDDQL